MIKFIYESEEPCDTSVKLSDVDNDQFFIDLDGRLCQKSSSNVYTVVAKGDGTLFCDIYQDVHEDVPILKVLSRVDEIEFQ